MAWFVKVKLNKGYKSQRYETQDEARAALADFLIDLRHSTMAQLGNDIAVRSSEVQTAEVVETADDDERPDGYIAVA